MHRLYIEIQLPYKKFECSVLFGFYFCENPITFFLPLAIFPSLIKELAVTLLLTTCPVKSNRTSIIIFLPESFYEPFHSGRVERHLPNWWMWSFSCVFHNHFWFTTNWLKKDPRDFCIREAFVSVIKQFTPSKGGFSCGKTGAFLGRVGRINTSYFWSASSYALQSTRPRFCAFP